MKLKQVIAAVLLAMMTMSALAEPAIITANTRVYQKASTYSASIKVKKGTEVELLSTQSGWALVERAGIQAYMKANQVETIESEPDYDALMKSAQPAKVTANTRVYQHTSTASASIKVKKGLKVNLLAVNNGWALVECNGIFAYMKAGQVKAVQTTPIATATPKPTATPEPEYEATPAVITANTRVYREASTSSASIKVSKGMLVDLLAVKGDWALVENAGIRAYMDEDHVEPRILTPIATATPKPTATPQPTATPKPTVTPVPDNYLYSDKYTNAQKCYLFMTKEMGLPSAAACGIMANIRHESNFNPTAGSTYYGLIQWGGGRKTNLKNFCAENGYGYDTLEGQLRFLDHELKKSYKSVLTFLQSVPDTAQGAYDAGYHFCYYYERPSNKASKSDKRGALARDTYFPEYAVV